MRVVPLLPLLIARREARGECVICGKSERCGECDGAAEELHGFVTPLPQDVQYDELTTAEAVG